MELDFPVLGVFYIMFGMTFFFNSMFQVNKNTTNQKTLYNRKFSEC